MFDLIHWAAQALCMTCGQTERLHTFGNMGNDKRMAGCQKLGGVVITEHQLQLRCGLLVLQQCTVFWTGSKGIPVQKGINKNEELSEHMWNVSIHHVYLRVCNVVSIRTTRLKCRHSHQATCFRCDMFLLQIAQASHSFRGRLSLS